MAATLRTRNRLKVVKLLGHEQDGAVVIAQTQDKEQFKVRCACSEVFIIQRMPLLRARKGRRVLNCPDCACKALAKIAADAAVTRNRIAGQFAPHSKEA